MAPEKPMVREDVPARPERVASGGKVLENVGDAPEKTIAPDTRAIAAGSTIDEPSKLGDGKIEEAVIPGAENKEGDGDSSDAHNANNEAGDASHGEKDEKEKQVEVEAKDSDPSVAAPKRANTFEKEATFYEYFAEAVVHDKETLHETYNKAQHSQYDFLGPQLFRKEKDKLDIRSKQAVLHLTYTDFRIKELENEVKKLRRDVDKLPNDFELNKKSKQPVYMHKLKRSNLQEFKLNEESKNVPDNKRPALEVLVSERVPTPLAPVASQESDVKAESPVITSIKEAGRRPSVLSDRLSGADAVYESPERLRIRSEALNALLGRISGDEIGNGFTKGEEHSPVVYLRPFKLFVTYEAEIRASVQEVETRIAKKAVPAPAPQLPSILAPKTAVPDFDDEDLLADLKLLVEFLDVDLKPTFELRKKIKEGTATSIEYQDLWHLFEIGDDVVSQTSKNLVYRVLHYTGGREPLIEKTEADPEIKITPVDGFVVDCYNLHFNGSMYGPKLSTFSIRKYRGSQPINSLTVYPMKFDASAISMKKDLLERGKEFLELTGSIHAHKMLIGKTLDEPPEEIDAQVIVDVTLAINKNPQWNPEFKLSDKDLTPPDRRETHQALFCSDYKYNEGCCGNDVCHKDLAWDDSRVSTYFRENRQVLGLRPASELLEDDKLLLPYSVYGFVLRSRRWVTLNISDLQEVKYENNFDELVLPPGHKDTVKALVRNHAKSSSSKSEATSKVGAAMDLVRGKGKGLIILLHGEPGVGKTSTAECVADLTQRPLFPITCGDIGETAAEVQKSLDYNFQLAHKWGCVLLLDEADVFLTKRNKTDLRRNAVVSVFLRTLEYYSGILFLTTNRVGSFDPAFKSRIHMSLFYPHLDLDATIKLYEVLLKRTIDEQKSSKTVEFKIRPKEILRFAKNHFRRLEKNGLGTWNGRQIRNAFQTAIALVEYEARQPTAVASTTLPSLGKAQFEIIAEASEEFDRYLKNTLGAVDADLARREQLRYDRYGEPTGRGKTTIQAASQQPIAGKRVLGRRNAKDPESEAELDDDDDDSEDDDDDDDDDDNDDDDKEEAGEREPEGGNTNANGHQVGKIGLSVPSPSVAGSSASGARDAMDEEYEEFLRFQQMRKNKAKK